MSQPIYIVLNKNSFCENIVEDHRVQATTGTQGYANQGKNNQYGGYDWTVWDGGSYGKMLRAAAHPGDRGFFIEVHDCGRFLSVKASYQSPATGKSVSQNFIVVLKDDNAEANVYMTSTKWRTVSSISQAASYIQQTIKSLAGYADRR